MDTNRDWIYRPIFIIFGILFDIKFTQGRADHGIGRFVLKGSISLVDGIRS